MLDAGFRCGMDFGVFFWIFTPFFICYMYLCIYNMYRQYIDIVLVNNIQYIFLALTIQYIVLQYCNIL
jgi:hypothetical protein